MPTRNRTDTDRSARVRAGDRPAVGIVGAGLPGVSVLADWSVVHGGFYTVVDDGLEVHARSGGAGSSCCAR